jgi:two-component system, cell cycle sensor histidine kinase and response regulator CckA
VVEEPHGWIKTRRPGIGGGAVAALVACTAAYWALILASAHSETTRTTIANTSVLPIGLLVIFLASRAGRHPALDRATRRAWMIIVAALCASWLGDVLWFVYETVLRTSPYPSWADAAYLAFYPLILVAVLAFPVVGRSRRDLTYLALDAGAVLVAGSMVIWYLVIYPTIEQGTGSPFVDALSLAYPVLDLVLLLALVVVALQRHSSQTTNALRYLALGLIAEFSGDVLFSTLNLRGVYTTGGLTDGLLVLSWLFFGVAGYVQYRDAFKSASRTVAQVAGFSFLPYAAVGAGVGILVYADRGTFSSPAGLLLVGTVMLAGIALTRQALTLRDRARAEQAVRKNQETLQAVFAASPLAVATTDLRENIAMWSPAAERIFGWSASELQGAPWPAVPADRRGESDAIREGWLKGDDLGVVHMVRLRKDHSLVELESSFAPLFDADAEVVGSVSIMRDVTEERRAQEQLRAVIDQAPMAIIQVDVEEKVQLWNPAAEEIFGWTKEEVLGKRLPFVSPEMREESEADRLRSVRGEIQSGLEITRRRKDGSLVDLQRWSTPLRDHDGNVVGIMGLLLDVTHTKQMQEQLRQAQKMEAVGQLAGGIAHDFNNLLTVILGNCEFALRSGLIDDSVRDGLEQTKEAAERASSLTRQILAFSRRQTMQPRVLSLNEILRDMEPLLKRTLGEDLDLHFVLDAHLGLVEVDPQQLGQVLLNLAVNARDAMEPGGTLSIETANIRLDHWFCLAHEGSRPGPHVTLTVSDTGCGMDAETQAHVFEPFFTTKPPGQGTGLGLATVYGIVKQSGGTISLTSEPGSGSSFKIYLPRAHVRATPAFADSAGALRAAHKRATVLLVEDEPAVLFLVGRILTSQGYDVIKAKDGAEAGRLLHEHVDTIDLLLTDVMLPGSLQGHVVARLAHVERPDLPVLFMSGYPRQALAHDGRLDEGINFIEKPFSPEALAQKVREVLDSRDL